LKFQSPETKGQYSFFESWVIWYAAIATKMRTPQLLTLPFTPLMPVRIDLQPAATLFG
jgi:hypothetical protein